MRHAGDHEEAHPGVLALTHFLEDALVVEHGVLGRDRRVGPPGVQQQLAAVRLERVQVGIDRVDEANLPVDDRHVAIEIERLPVIVGILKRPDPHRVDHLGRRRAPQRRHRIAERLAGENQLTLAVLEAAVVVLHSLELRPGQTGVRFRAHAQQRGEIEAALARIVQEAFLERVALLHDRRRDHLRFDLRDRLIRVSGQVDAAREAGGVHVDVPVGKRTGDDAVEIERIPLRRHDGLAPAGRASLEIGVPR